MTYRTAAPRLTLWRAVLIAAVTALALVATAAVASAAVVTIQPDGLTGTLDNLGTAIKNANTAGGSNTIILSPGSYEPQGLIESGFGLPEIKNNLTIVDNHAAQAPFGTSTATIYGTNADGATNGEDLFTVDGGYTLTLEGVEITAANGNNDLSHAAIHVKAGGTLVLDDSLLENNDGGEGIQVDTGATATINESTIDFGTAGSGINNLGTVTLNNADVTNNDTFGISNGGTATANNTLIAGNSDEDCTGTKLGDDDSIADDTSCTGLPDDPVILPISVTSNGGPTQTYALTGAPTAGAGDPAKCPTTDQRFFVNPVNKVTHLPQCDVGSYTSSATRETTGPSCSVTSTFYPPGYPNASTSATQTVGVTDPGGSGLGPEYGSPADPQASTTSTNPADAISNTTITNGTVALLNLFLVPSTTQLNVEATKAVGGTTTRWSFDATNWAGVTTYCH
jgi:hypothetical protein